VSKAGDRILKSVREAQAYARGEVVDGFVLHEFVDVKALRARLGLAQPEFAARFGLSVSTLRDWEQGRAVPDGPAQVLLRVIEAAPELVAQVTARG
jgi:putative transcriptional regulator